MSLEFHPDGRLKLPPNYECNDDEFIILGYLASKSRMTKLDIETHPSSRAVVEEKYEKLTGQTLVNDNVNYFIWPPDYNKWGSELRIYFFRNNNLPDELNSMIRRPANIGKYNARINNNKFVWKLIQFGFRTSNIQNIELIKSKIHPEKLHLFEKGLNM